jgi:hypothetical protein
MLMLGTSTLALLSLPVQTGSFFVAAGELSAVDLLGRPARHDL